MMNFLVAPLIVGICIAGVYGLFELFVRRKERLAIIEKMGDKLYDPSFSKRLGLPNYTNFSFSALKLGCLMAGIGLGLLVGFIINISLADSFQQDGWFRNEISGTAYGASVLLFGGIGLIIAFVLEMKIAKKEKKDNQ